MYKLDRADPANAQNVSHLSARSSRNGYEAKAGEEGRELQAEREQSITRADGSQAHLKSRRTLEQSIWNPANFKRRMGNAVVRPDPVEGQSPLEIFPVTKPEISVESSAAEKSASLLSDDAVPAAVKAHGHTAREVWLKDADAAQKSQSETEAVLSTSRFQGRRSARLLKKLDDMTPEEIKQQKDDQAKALEALRQIHIEIKERNNLEAEKSIMRNMKPVTTSLIKKGNHILDMPVPLLESMDVLIPKSAQDSIKPLQKAVATTSIQLDAPLFIKTNRPTILQATAVKSSLKLADSRWA